FSGLHVLYDAFSLDLIFSELYHLYNSKPVPDVTPFEPVLGSILANCLDDDPEGDKFWRDTMKEAQPTKFPNMSPVRVPQPQVKELTRVSSRSLSYLQNGCRDAGSTLQAAGQTAWARLLSSYTGESNVTYGLVLSGRTMSVEAQRVVFPCLVTVPSSYE